MNEQQTNTPIPITIRELIQWFFVYVNGMEVDGYDDNDVTLSSIETLILPLTRTTIESIESALGDCLPVGLDNDNQMSWTTWINFMKEFRQDYMAELYTIIPANIRGIKLMSITTLQRWLTDILNGEDEDLMAEPEDLDHPWDFDGDLLDGLRYYLPTRLVRMIPQMPPPAASEEEGRRESATARRIWVDIMVQRYRETEHWDVWFTDYANSITPASPPIEPVDSIPMEPAPELYTPVTVDIYVNLAEAKARLFSLLERNGFSQGSTVNDLDLPIRAENRMHILNATGVYPPAAGDGAEEQWRRDIASILLKHCGFRVHWVDGDAPETAPEGYSHPWLRMPGRRPGHRPVSMPSDMIDEAVRMARIQFDPPPPDSNDHARLFPVPGINVGATVPYTIAGHESRPNMATRSTNHSQMIELALACAVRPIPPGLTKQLFAINMGNELIARAVRTNEHVLSSREFFRANALYQHNTDHGEHDPNFILSDMQTYNWSDRNTVATFCFYWLRQSDHPDVNAYFSMLPQGSFPFEEPIFNISF